MHHLIGRDEPLNLPGTPASRGRGEILRPFCFSQCHRLGGRCIKAALKSLEGSWGERLGSGGPSLWMPSLVPPPAACVLGAGRFPSVSSGSVEAQAHEVQVDKMLEKDTLEVIDLQGLAYFSCLFLVQKAVGGWSQVINLLAFNHYVTLAPFSMETVA